MCAGILHGYRLPPHLPGTRGELLPRPVVANGNMKTDILA
jgi:hypothetical protein